MGGKHSKTSAKSRSGSTSYARRSVDNVDSKPQQVQSATVPARINGQHAVPGARLTQTSAAFQPPPRPPPPPPPPARQTIVALYDYDPQGNEDLSFKKGEQMELVDRQESDWWVARKGDSVGYVPSNYVQVDDGRPESADCYFNIVRRDAERMLLAPFVKQGHFIVRPSSSANSLALSVRAHDADSDLPVVRHYRIRMMDNCRGYYIAAHQVFASFNELAAHYRACADGLCCPLTTACPKSRPPHLRMRDVEVARRNVTILREIGRGNFGEVYFGKLNGVIEVAVKQLKNNGQMSNEKFLKEAQIMHKLLHEKIVQLIAVCTTELPVLIITEYMPKDSLCDYLRELGNRPLANCPPGWDSLFVRFSKHVDMMAQVAMGMAYLEANNFIHRDLRAANILVGEDNVVKVSDFGLAALIENQDDAYTVHEETKFPIRWTAPEAIYERRFSIKSDVWSFAVLVYEIVTMGNQPYAGKSNKDVIEAVNCGYRLPNPHNATTVLCPPALYDEIMLKCWKAEAENRPRFERLAEMLDSFETAELEIRYDDGQSSRPAPRKRT